MVSRPTRRRCLTTAAVLLLGGAVVPPMAAGADGPPTARGAATTAASARPATDRGTWRVVATGQGRYAVSWTSPRRLPTTSDRPTITGAGLAFGPSVVAGDRRTVRTVVTSRTAPRASRLDVLLSGDRLDEPGDDVRREVSSAPAPSRPVARATTKPLLGVDPGAPGPYPVTSSDYSLAPVKLPGMPRPIEMVGHVVEPTAAAVTGPRPLVLFLHGRHDYCYRPDGKPQRDYSWPCRTPNAEIPSQLGYVYIQRRLASQGFTTVSVRVNGINAQDYLLADGGATARATIVRHHLDHWVGIAAAHQSDLQHVVLVGHSRGGEGVDRASIEIPLSAPYRIAGQVLIAPTDFGSQTAPYIPTVTLLPYCDGDVSDLQGQRFTDVARDVVAGDTSLKSSVLVMGANHNFFNTEWTPSTAAAPSFDDWGGARDRPCGRDTPQRLRGSEQRQVGAAYVAGAVHLFADGDQAYLPLFDGSSVTVPSIGDADVRSAAVGGGRDVRRPGLDATRTLPRGARTSLCTGLADFRVRPGLCGSASGDVITPSWPNVGERVPTRRFLEMSWTRVGQTGGLGLDRPLDLSTRRLELRTIVDGDRSSVGFRVRLTDDQGHAALLTPQGGATLRSFLRAPSLTKLWARAVLVDPSAAAGIDLTRVTRVELVSTSSRGRVWLADVSAAPATLPAVPVRRAATVDLGGLRRFEGDRGTVTAQVPFRVHGTLTAPARLSIVTSGQQVGSQERYTVDLAPGQTSGAIAVPYDADTIDDLSPATTSLAAWPLSGIMTDDWTNQLDVVDDDPTPAVTVRVVDPTVSEGQAVRVEVRLARRVDYSTFVDASVVNRGRHRLRVGDVPLSWLRTHASGSTEHPYDPLKAYVYAQVPAGRTTTQLVVPIARDGYREQAESLTLRIRVNEHSEVIRTVYIAPSPGDEPEPTAPPAQAPTTTSSPVG